MAKISAELRERLLAQKKSMQRGGMLIRNKGFSRMKLRILPPPEGELPGVENTSFFSKTLNKGTTSPLSWKIACPVADALDRIYRESAKEDKDAAKQFVRRTVEYWIPVIDRADEGTPQNPKIRILAGKQSIYQKITDWMLDEEDGEDITDPIEGRDVIVRKKGSGLDTEWDIDKGDKSPISEDEEMANAWVELASKFDVRSRFYIPKLDVLQGMYEGLTGEKIPKSYLEPIKELIAQLEAGGHVDPDAEDTEVEVESVEVAAPAETEEVATEDADDGDLTGRTVQFDNGGTTVQGTVSGADDDEEGHWLVVEDGGNPDEPWSIAAEQLTLVEVEEVETEEPEEAPAPPAPKKKTIAAAPAKPAAAPAKPAPKPAATKTSIPAKAAPAKPAVAAPKAAPKAAPAGLPRKPGAAPAAPKASSAIKAGLKSRIAGKK